MRLIYCLLLLLCPYVNKAQAVANIKPVAIGDRVPDMVFNQITNYKQNTTRLSQFKGKLLLLDFWATWCGNCIKKFDMLDSMQRQYPDKLQVLLINPANTRDTKEKLDRFFKRQKNANGNPLILPAVYNDTIANSYFPHAYMPHYCWIDANQRCIAITGADDVTAANIEAVLNKGTATLAGIQLMNDFDFNKPLFVDGNGGAGAGIMFRSTLSRYIPGMLPAARYSRDKHNLTTHYSIINTPLLELIKLLYRVDPRNDRIVFEVSDSMTAVLLPKTDAAIIANSFSYEIIGPPVDNNTVLQCARQDMERYFGITAKKEKRPAPCYLLTADTNILAKYRSQNEKPVNNLYEKERRYMQNKPLASLTAYLDGILDKYVLQRITISYNLDISLPDIPPNDIAALKTALVSFGITLTPSTELTEQFVIYQTPKQ